VRVRLERLELVGEEKIDAMERDELVALAKIWRQRLDVLQTLVFRLRRHQFGQRSERSQPEMKDQPKPASSRSETIKLPSERYPNANIRADRIDFSTPPACPVCGEPMIDSGMTEDSEYVDVEAKEFFVVQQKRHKHRCPRCHGAISTAPTPPRVMPGGSYSDDLIIDASLSKYCDLIPMERYCQMAGRSGFPDLPPHSLIQASFRLAEFLREIYLLIRQETLRSPVLLADETPHRMLEGDERKRWYLWGFSNATACFFECHDSRSGDVSTGILLLSRCEVLLTDAYSGYRKSINEANKTRAEQGLALIQTAYCNIHARRQFLPANGDLEAASDEVKFIVGQYEKIYELNDEAKGLSAEAVLEKRGQMKSYFEAMKKEATAKVETYSDKSAMGQAYNYFLKYYDNLTLCLTDPRVPLDNNASERLLRSHVVGRKTWYGTHSRTGAETAAIHFSIVESCKLNKVNPRLYYRDMVSRIHNKKGLLTPRQYRDLLFDNDDSG